MGGPHWPIAGKCIYRAIHHAADIPAKNQLIA
jgi:hypothetical protein